MTSAKKKILLVDDEPGMLEPMAQYLSYELQGHDILTANDGQKALDILARDKIALVVSDIKMPKVSGLELLAEIQAHYPQTSVILMSAYGNHQIRDELKKDSFLRFISKPFSVAELKDLIVDFFDKDESGFQGVLKNIQLNDIIQMCCLSMTDMAIQVWKGSESGVVFIKNGEIVHATFGETVGEEAFYQIVAWESGQFETLGNMEAPVVSIERDWHFLLMEAARLCDEKTLQTQNGSTPDSPPPDDIVPADSALPVQRPSTESNRTEAAAEKKRARVLIVDDSAMMSKILTQLLTQDESIEVVGAAKNGQEALKEISALKPDLITLDVNMPVMDGGTALKHIMIKSPCPVVIVSNVGRQSQLNIVDFLRLGAVDFIGKPKRSKNMTHQQQQIIRCIKKSSKARVNNYRRGKAAKLLRQTPASSAKLIPDPSSTLIVINSGTGGYGELIKIIPMFSASMNAAVLALQAMPSEFLEPFAAYLDERSAAQVLPLHPDRSPQKLSSAKIPAWKLNQGACYMGTHDMVEREGSVQMGRANGNYYIGLKKNTKKRGFDNMLHSIARTFEGVIQVVLLSGADVGSLKALGHIKANNGMIISQKLDTCMVPDPLQKVKAAGLVSCEANPVEIVKRIFESIG